MFERLEKHENPILFLRIGFEASAKEIPGYVALLMDIPSIEGLRFLVADLVTGVAPNTDRPGD